jgi:hypothetical protein
MRMAPLGPQTMPAGEQVLLQCDSTCSQFGDCPTVGLTVMMKTCSLMAVYRTQWPIGWG